MNPTYMRVQFFSSSSPELPRPVPCPPRRQPPPPASYLLLRFTLTLTLLLPCPMVGDVTEADELLKVLPPPRGLGNAPGITRKGGLLAVRTHLLLRAPGSMW